MVGKFTAMGRVGYLCVGNVLSGGGTSGSIVWTGIVGPVGFNDKYVKGNPYKIPTAYCGEYGAEKHIWYVDRGSGSDALNAGSN